MISEELKATEALLDIGVSVPLRPVRFRAWNWTPRVTVRRPPLGGFLRILRVWFSLNVTVEELDKFTREERLRFLEKNGKAVSKIVALAVFSSYIRGRVLAPVFAWFLRWRCHPDVMLYVVSEFMRLQDAQSFIDITKSVATINIVAPRLGQKRKRS